MKSLIITLSFTGCVHLGFVDTPLTQKEIKKSYYPNGNIEYEVEYLNGKLDGISRVWSENGTLVSISEYSNNQPNGVWNIFYPDGTLMHEVQYEFGKKHGYDRWYHENGKLKSEQKYNYNEAEAEMIRWNPDGTILY